MNNTEDRYEEYEEYTRKKYIAIAVVVALILIGLAIHGFKMLYDAIKESSEETDRIVSEARKMLTEGLEEYYGLKENVYVVTDRKGEKSGHPVYSFETLDNAYTAAIGTEGLCTDFYVNGYYRAVEDYVSGLIEETGLIPEGLPYRVFEVRCTFNGHRENYEKRCKAELLPVWLEANELSKFRDGKVNDRERWMNEIHTYVTIYVDQPWDVKLTAESFAAVREELSLFADEFRIGILQSEGGRAYKVYVYNPRKDIVTTDSYLAPEE